MRVRKITVRLDAFSRGVVLLDGEPLDNVRAVKVEARVNTPTSVTLELSGCEVEVEAEEHVE